MLGRQPISKVFPTVDPHANSDDRVMQAISEALRVYTGHALEDFHTYSVTQEIVRDAYKNREKRLNPLSILKRWNKPSVFFAVGETRTLAFAVIPKSWYKRKSYGHTAGYIWKCVGVVEFGGIRKDVDDDVIDGDVGRWRLTEKLRKEVGDIVGYVMQSILDRPHEYRNEEAERRGPTFPSDDNRPRSYVIDIGRAVVHGPRNEYQGGGGWKVGEYTVNSHWRTLRDGRRIMIQGHKRGDPTIPIKSRTKIVDSRISE